ncbi:hypothetical protein GY45DRAFT_1324448 [Cubamyces sp. BRFM 1775]|nr:hypothetical protein GY45DRAFT_1324448 [Cubamyces sp. BRFM 1775]
MSLPKRSSLLPVAAITISATVATVACSAYLLWARDYRRRGSNATGNGVASTDRDPHVIASWRSLVDHLGIQDTITGRDALTDFSMGHSPAEVSTDAADEYDHLYEDCIRYLEDMYPPASFAASIPDGLANTGLADLPPCFGTLVNLLGDIIPWHAVARALSTSTPLQVCIPANISRSAIPYIMVVARLAVTDDEDGPVKSIFAKALASSPAARLTTDDLYRALFVDYMSHFWRRDCVRRQMSSRRSPMPWSAMSIEELSAADGGTPDTIVRTLHEHDLNMYMDVDTERWRLGCPLDVPWLGADHDGYPFCPTLSTYTATRLPLGTIHSLRDDAALWVSTMTLGLLEAVTRMRIPESILLVPGSREGVIVLSGLGMLRVLLFWRHHILEAIGDDEASLEEARRILHLLQRALAVLHEDEYQKAVLAGAGLSKEQQDDVHAGVAHMLLFLCTVALKNFMDVPELCSLCEEIRWSLSRNFSTALMRTLMYKLLDRGWCPKTLTYFPGEMIFIIPNLVNLPPYTRDGPEDHLLCDDNSCTLYTITDESTYVPRHVHPSCCCEYLKPPVGDVSYLLAQGLVPAVIFDGATLRVVPAVEKPYVAISHVWAEGMGSTTDDGLPTCVIERIAKLVWCTVPAGDHVPFWMDSLCVPKARDERKRAIRLMAQTYRDADKVLVIDDCIRKLCSFDSCWDENLVRIFTSQWVRRVWTLQEGLLARELWFEFADGVVCASEELSPEDLGISRVLVPLLNFRAYQRRLEAPQGVRLQDLVSMIQMRSTSKPEDELIAISSLLPSRVELDVLLSDSEDSGSDVVETRMRSFLLQLREIPRGVPFWGAPRLTMPGFTWAPRTLTAEVSRSWSTELGVGICTEDGLVAEYLLAKLEEPISLLPDPSTCGGDGAGIPTDIVKGGGIFVSHESSRTTYGLVPQKADYAPCTFDALLFLDGDQIMMGSTSQMMQCIAVAYDANSVTGSDLNAVGVLADAPLRCRYVLYCDLTPFTGRPVAGRGLGELSKTWVRLA